MKKILIVLVLINAVYITHAQSWDDTVRSIEKIFERYKPSAPGAQLAISRNGQLIYSKAWGIADMEHNVPLTTVSIAEAGSVSKQFTAAAILLLEQEGKLSLDDDVRKYIPELPDYGYVIKLQHMMHHTSGIRDWGSIAALSGWPRSTKTYSNDDALYILTKQRSLNNKPGDEFIYSNSNYNLFAIIVERVSGMSLAAYTKKKIFEPAGMTHTEWRDDFKKIVPNRAIAYAREGQYFTNMPNEYVYGNGGLLTTAEDLVKWTNYYSAGKLGSPGLYQKQIAVNPFNNGVMNRYAGGLFISKYNDLDMISHDGATASYRCNLEYFPSLGLVIAWLSNSSEFDRNPVSVTDGVRKLFIKPASTTVEAPQQGTFAVSAEKLNNYAGWYSNTRSGVGLKVFVKNDKLQATQLGLLSPVSENVFNFMNNRIEFSPKKGFLFINSAKDSIYFTAVDSASLTPAKMNEYVGDYYSDEVQAGYSVIVKDGKLFVHQAPKNDFPMTPTYKDAFEVPPGSLYFERDKKKNITGFKISISRARNVSFRKIK